MLQVGNINPEGSEGFSSAETELEMSVGVGRHDSSLTNIIYDQVSSVQIQRQYCEQPPAPDHGETLLMITNDWRT